MIVDYSYYSGTYMGTEADEASFPALCARAEDVVGAMTRWQVTEDNIAQLPAMVQALYKKAICAQTDAFAINGTADSLAGGDAHGWTVGHVSISGRSGGELVHKGGMADSVSPMAQLYLEQTGLMGPQVATAMDAPLIYGWW